MRDEALKSALSCIKSSAEYKRGNATFIEAAEDVEQALAAPVQKGAIGAEYQKSPWDGKGASMSPPAAQQPDVDAMIALARADERKAIYDLVMEAPFKEFDRQEEDFDGEAANAMKAMAFSLSAAIRNRGNT